MITDTCRCGASALFDHDCYLEERRSHAEWLAAHEVCRRLVTTKADGMECTTVVDASGDIDDAARFRWLLGGRGYFMEEEHLCGHGSGCEVESNNARDVIDAAMREDTA